MVHRLKKIIMTRNIIEIDNFFSSQYTIQLYRDAGGVRVGIRRRKEGEKEGGERKEEEKKRGGKAPDTILNVFVHLV